MDKAFEALRWMIDAPQESCGVREISRGLKRPPSTVHRTLAALEAQGLVVGDPETGRYELGMEAYRLGAHLVSRFSLGHAATPYLESLNNDFNETAFLSVYDRRRHEMMMARVVETNQAVRYVVATNEWSPVYLGASGLAILAFLPEEEQELVLSQMPGRVRSGSGTVEREAVIETLELVRARGFAYTIGQRVPDAVGIAAPIRDGGGVVLGAIGITLPSSRYTEDSGMADAVVEAARTFSDALA